VSTPCHTNYKLKHSALQSIKFILYRNVNDWRPSYGYEIRSAQREFWAVIWYSEACRYVGGCEPEVFVRVKNFHLRYLRPRPHPRLPRSQPQKNRSQMSRMSLSQTQKSAEPEMPTAQKKMRARNRYSLAQQLCILHIFVNAIIYISMYDFIWGEAYTHLWRAYLAFQYGGTGKWGLPPDRREYDSWCAEPLVRSEELLLESRERESIQLRPWYSWAARYN